MRNKIIIVTILFIGLVTVYYVKNNSTNIPSKNKIINSKSNSYELYRVNKCEQEQLEYLCRLDFKSSSKILSIGLKERYIPFVKGKKIQIELYQENGKDCLKSISFESFKEEMTYCIPAFSQNI